MLDLIIWSLRCLTECSSDGNLLALKILIYWAKVWVISSLWKVECLGQCCWASTQAMLFSLASVLQESQGENVIDYSSWVQWTLESAISSLLQALLLCRKTKASRKNSWFECRVVRDGSQWTEPSLPPVQGWPSGLVVIGYLHPSFNFCRLSQVHLYLSSPLWCSSSGPQAMNSSRIIWDVRPGTGFSLLTRPTLCLSQFKVVLPR